MSTVSQRSGNGKTRNSSPAERRLPPCNTLDQATRDLIAHLPKSDNAANRKAVFLAAMDLFYVLFDCIYKDDPGGIVYELLGTDQMNFNSEDGSEEGVGVYWEIIRAAERYREDRKGICSPAFTTDWWVDRKQVPPDMAYVVKGKPKPTPEEATRDYLEGKPKPAPKPGPSPGLQARDAELWGDEDGGDDE